MFKLIDRSIATVGCTDVASDMTVQTDSRPHDSQVAAVTPSSTALQTAKIIKKLIDDAHSMRETYYVGVSPYIVAYRLLNQTDQVPIVIDPTIQTQAPIDDARRTHTQAEDAIRVAYTEFIGEKGIISMIDRCVETITMLLRCTTICSIDGVDELKELGVALERSDQFKVTQTIESMSTGDCDCGGEFVMYAESNERKCNTCGMTATIYDSAIDDANLYAQEVQKTKQNRHHPIQHCKVWVGRIQAWVGPNVPDSVYDQLRVCFTRDSTNLKNITCRRIRKYLKEKKLTAFNNFVPFIRKVLTGISPPQLTTPELNKLYETFTQVAKILQDMRPDNNINYYPVFIFKILDEQLPLGARKVQIMECIHLQSENTVKVIDNLYAQICARMGRLDKPRSINWGEYKKLL